MSNFSENVRRDIERDGVSIIYVGDATPPFAYTIGLWERHKHPELIVFGLSGRVMWSWLNALSVFVSEGQNFSAKVFLKDVGGRFGVTVGPADSKYLEKYFGFALGFYEQQFPIAQVIWPDSEGCFPGEDLYNAKYANLQPILA
jgi:hypothetical protein